MSTEVPFRPLPIDQSQVRYAHGPDSFQQPDVPAGPVMEFVWADSAVYPGTSRRVWLQCPPSTNRRSPRR